MDLGRLTWSFIPRFLALVIVVAINWHLLHDATKSSEETAPLPNITIIGTGGTIAGATNSPDKTTDYEAGIVQIDALTRGIDEAWRNNAVVYHEQFMSVDSININSSLAISLSQHVTKVANNPYTQGIVLTHGTDLMPEMAMFLSLTVTSRKPIVMTGAMWPHTAFSADGPGNIIAAVKTAATIGWSSEGREVVIVIQGKIMAPWAIKKDNNQFLPGPGSLLGDIKDFEPFFRWLPGPCTPIKFDISELSPETPLPEVVIFQAHQDFPAYLIEVAISMGVKGIVLVGYGDGYWPAASAKEIRKLVHESRVVVVFAAEGQSEYVANARIGVGIPGGDWNPRQLRILLQLLLWSGAGEEEIRSAILNFPEWSYCRQALGLPARSQMGIWQGVLTAMVQLWEGTTHFDRCWAQLMSIFYNWNMGLWLLQGLLRV
ncbi:hypothetical protein BFJ63_vAg16119 [Fusarium oxysporum f. sp. narcissi]|uniref:asparaginase n=1 Tax=Fusarium oxysporum f. sp. narcissi TaxID=451672 RepID=A0A4Q2V2Z0_FUSOX|nr:hypothetical protein BFJ63_vAg16119 [Fusarium oxysporum f. sp. narcissi]